MKILEENENGLKLKTNDGHVITYPYYNPLHTENLIPKLYKFAKEHDLLMKDLKPKANELKADSSKELFASLFMLSIYSITPYRKIARDVYKITDQFYGHHKR